LSDARNHYNKYNPDAVRGKRRTGKWQNWATGILVDISFALGTLNGVKKPRKGAAHPPRPFGRKHIGGPTF
jgi:hypothetical protein